MALETGTYISDLVTTNPAAGDGLVDADNHMRLIKTLIKATFPNITGAVTPTHTELNYVDGVTSAIQTQLDAKVTQATVDAALALKANLAGPTFTGVPAAPTAAPATNTTQLATTAFVEAARVILAAATALKADLAGPTFTGVPAAPTAAPGTNTTQISTTAFVTAAVAAGGGIAAASQAEQEAASSTTVAVTPGRQHFHPSAAKFWVKATANSTTIVASYNMTSWADTQVGRATGTIATDFSSADWALIMGLQKATGWGGALENFAYGIDQQAAGTFEIRSANDADNAADASAWHVVGFGDQA